MEITAQKRTERESGEAEGGRKSFGAGKIGDRERIILENQSEISIGIDAKTTVKLPKLQMESFSGTILNWKLFWDAFKTAIDDHPCLKPVEKMNYLVCQRMKHWPQCQA